ncbi:MAG: ABC transporter substrate-binding protein [Coriobacteriales bacterium]|nr:ABC transporter substrate-binding protein [Coriobacteriales bacterium]
MEDRNHVIVDRRAFLKFAAISGVTVMMFGINACTAPWQKPADGNDTPDDQTPEPAAKTEWKFKDQNDYDVSLLVPCERIVVLQHHCLDMLCQLGAQDRIVGVVDSWKKNLGDYMTTVFPGIESMPTPGGLSEWNVEKIAELQPDVVIAASQAPEDAMKQIKDLGIPVVVISLRGEGKQAQAQNPRLANADAAYTEGLQWAITTLGKISGKDDVAANIWSFVEESRALVDKAVGNIADADRVKVAVLANKIAYGNDKYVGCQLLRAGAVNAVALAGVQGNTDFNAELVAKWDPDVIITQDRYPEDYKTITTDPGYAEVRAVKAGKVIEAPYWTKPWGNPDTDSMALGELWLAHTLYPDKVSAKEVQDRAEAFYQQFYGIKFSDTVK